MGMGYSFTNHREDPGCMGVENSPPQLQVRDKQDIIASLPLVPMREELLLAGNRRVHLGGMMIISTKQLLGTW